MAFDPRTRPNPLDPAMVNELRAALSRSANSGNHGDELKQLLMRAANEARSKGIQAEQLLVALKDIWYSLPQLTQSSNDVQSRLLQQLVARCIQEYYAA
jgi:hypothetical protein